MRYPFLDPTLAGYVRSLPLETLVDYSKPKGEGDKQLLREMALRMGLRIAAGNAKKAIQFGTGLAKESNVARYGSNRKGKGH
jgi:hypothetical protein